MEELFSTVKIAEHITRIVLPGHVYGYLAEGEDRAVLIDTGYGLGSLRTYVESLLQGKPYEVVLTHGHVDHAGGASEFDRVWLNEKDWPMAAEHTQKPLRAGMLRSNPELVFTDEDLTAPKTEGYLPLEYGQTFDLGGEVLEIICFGGHTFGSVGILFKNDRILLTGDACCSYTLLFGTGLSLSVPEYKANLEAAWSRYQGCMDQMLYSHPHNYGGPEVIPQMIEVCTDIEKGTDDHVSMESLGRKGYLAKAIGEDMKRLDGKIANLVFS